jgi:hypothetical protein
LTVSGPTLQINLQAPEGVKLYAAEPQITGTKIQILDPILPKKLLPRNINMLKEKGIAILPLRTPMAKEARQHREQIVS